jgi:hypothetical protein
MLCLVAEVTMDVIAAQALVFFIAGFETSSSTMAFCLYELAVNPDIQDRLRAEIDTVLRKHGGAVSYDAVSEMEYLGKVVNGKSHTGEERYLKLCSTSQVDVNSSKRRTGSIFR